MNRRDTVERAATQWARDLTDESGRNRLLYYKELKTGTLSLDNARPLVQKRLLSGRKVQTQELFPHEYFEDAVRRIRAVNRKAVANYEEKGINTLFLGWGMATWTPASSSATPNAPVLLCPVDLERTGAAEVDFDMRLNGDWTLNEALLQHLDNEFNVDVSGESLMDPYGDGEQISEEEEQAIFAELSRRAERVPDFAIFEQVVLGNFMFKKMPMVNDINNNLEALSQHDLIAAVAGDEEAGASLRTHHAASVAKSLPDSTPPENEYLVLDADSSQNAAINAALAGESFVLQGPPGTGKSQTISNLIAAMMAEGKSVLFVAEKRAAIDAVIKRLTRVGLDQYVMDLHGGVSSRKELARLLDQSLTAIGQTPPHEQPDLHQRLRESRSELSGYAESLHREREPWDISYFGAQSQLLALEQRLAPSGDKPQPLLPFSSAALAELSASKAQQVRRDIKDWADLSRPLRLGQSAWTGARITTPDEARHALNSCLYLLNEHLPTMQAQVQRLCAELDVREPETIDGCSELAAEVFMLDQKISLAERSLTLEVFHKDVSRLAQDMTSAAKGMIGRMLSKRFRTAKAELDELHPGKSKLKASAALEAITAANSAVTRWKELGYSGSPRNIANAEHASGAFDKANSKISDFKRFVPECDSASMSISELAELSRALLAEERALFQLPQLHEVQQRLRAAHVGHLLDAVANDELADDELASAFDLCWLSSILREVRLGDRRISGFQGVRQNRYVEEFRQADANHLKINPARVARRVAEHAIATLNQVSDQDQLIRKEANKKTRHLPLRRLFEQAPEALAALRPCWAMSPLDVAQTLPPRPLFDLVVFDEASQVLPCDAIPALLRGGRAMVAGDSRQLPPTSFFDTSGDDDLDEDEESMADFESILDVMDTRLTRRPLTWHYRSQDERLIAYSNQEIYHGSLTTFPGADSDKCLDWVLVPHRNGVATLKGSNSDEVLRVVDLMIEHAHQRPNESLGVIAMGLNHANRIEESLRQRIEAENSAHLEEFFKESHEERAFVKNLERVQGDERDAIILSIGYGKNADGRMQYRFGPMNQQGGERRLNVAITRARRRMTLVSSFDYADMDPDRTRSTGANMLRGFLKFAQSGGSELDGADEQTPLNAFEIDVLDKLTAAGLSVVPQYGCSGYRIDFAICHPTRPGQFALAVEADGAAYHSSPTARDRDRLRQEHLERLGWRFCRIWSTDWFSDPQREVDRVLVAYEKALVEIDKGQVDPADDSPNESPGTSDGGISPRPTMPPPPRLPKPPILHYASIDDYSLEELVSIARWIESDGLLRTDSQLFEAIFNELPFNRRGTRIVEAINNAILVDRSGWFVSDGVQDS
ncbi:MAG: DUF4011 domain-containing protein [Acidimicrobiia bacterium]|nr:DUF4011 domain-containing protein [Acidimicrobiia bacterium]